MNLKILNVFIIILITAFIGGISFAYEPPKGIPDPADSFSTFGEIDQSTPNTAAKCPTWPTAATIGCYYVDNTDPVATDSSNTYGYPNKPRLTIPSLTLNAGNFVYVNAGTYAPDLYLKGAGTAANPIWFTGNSTTHPVLSGGLFVGYNVGASYAVIENFDWVGSNIKWDVRVTAKDLKIDHIIFRNNTATGVGTDSDTSFGRIGNTSALTGTWVDYIVIYNNTISGLGDITSTKDITGVAAVREVDHLWVLNNDIYAIGSDSVAGCATCSASPNDFPTNYYVGGNTMYGNGENCIDFKGVSGIIVSENVCYGPFAKEQGNGFTFQMDGSDSCSNVWVLFNKIHTVGEGIALRNATKNVYIIGNLIYDIANSYSAQEDPQFGGAVLVANSNPENIWIVDNTFYDYETHGLNFYSTLDSGENVKIHGNIFSGRSDETGYEVKVLQNGSEAYIDLDYNLFYGYGGTSRFYWANDTRTYSYMTGTASECANCVDGSNPTFVSPSSDLSLQSGSTCIGANIEGPVGASVYDAFYTAYSLDIKKDYLGTVRPQGSAWDIGAYEFRSNTPMIGVYNVKGMSGYYNANGMVGIAPN